jgi:glutamyl-tRNA reductase
MSLTLIGLSHHHTPIALRERVCITTDQLPAALQSLEEHTRQAVILSTCNRTEILAHGICPQGLLHWLAAYKRLDTAQLEPHVYMHHDAAAVHHAMRVASGLDSMVLGEPQILGQFKTALQTARDHDMVKAELDHTFRHILSAAKAVRTQTSIGYCPVSVAFSAVRLAEQTQCPLAQQHAVLIGSGETVELLAKHLTTAGIGKLSVVGRNVERGAAIADDYQAHCHAWTELSTVLATADIVISATAASDVIIDLSLAQQAWVDGGQRRIIDLAMPRDIDPAVSTLPGIELHCLDDIQKVINTNTLQRTQAAMQAGEILKAHLGQYITSYQERHAADTITALRGQLQGIRDHELSQSLQRIAAGEDPTDVLQSFAHSLTNKWLHQPSLQLKAACTEGNTELLESAKQLFAIEH